jgi:hypothetical protein
LQFTTSGLQEINEIGLKVMADMITYEVLCCGSGGETPENCDCADKFCDSGLRAYRQATSRFMRRPPLARSTPILGDEV